MIVSFPRRRGRGCQSPIEPSSHFARMSGPAFPEGVNVRGRPRLGKLLRSLLCVAVVGVFALAGRGPGVASAYSGTISPGGAPLTVAFASGDVADITFFGFAGQRVSLTMDGNLFTGGCVANFWIHNPDTSLLVDRSYGSSGSCIWGGNGGPVGSSTGFIGPLTLPQTGTYTMTFDPWGTLAGSVTFTMFDLPADPSPTLTPSSGGTPLTATVSLPGMDLRPTFQGTAGQRISLNLGWTLQSGGCVGNLYVYKPDGSLLLSQVYGGPGTCIWGGNPWINTTTLPADGTYRIVFDAWAGLTGDVTFTLDDIPPDPLPVLVASQLPAGNPATVNIVTPGQNTQPTFQGTSGQRVSLNLGWTLPSNGGCAGELFIYNPDGSTLLSRYYGGPGTCIYASGWIDTLQLNQTGTYRIFFDTWKTLTGNVTFTLYDVPPDPSPLLTVGGAATQVVITTPGQNAQPQFDGFQGQPLRLTLTNSIGASTSCIADFWVIAPGGATILDETRFGPNTCYWGANMGPWNLPSLPSTGRYTVFFSPWYGDVGSATFSLAQVGGFVPLEQAAGCSATHASNGADGKCKEDPVDPLTGSFTDHATDIALPGLGVGFSFSRSYSSFDSVSAGRLGSGWRDNLSAYLDVHPDGDVTLHGEDGQQVEYTKNTDGSFARFGATTSELTFGAGGYQLVRHDQTVYVFNATGRLLSIKDRNGKGVTLAYDGSSRLATVTDATGRQATLGYNASNLVSSVTSSDSRLVSYGYTAGRLTTVTDVRGKVWTYGYDGTGRLASLQDPNLHFRYRNSYDPTSGRVTQQLDPLGNSSAFAWNASTQTATTTDAAGKQWKDVFSGNTLVQKIDPLNHVTKYEYDAKLNLVKVTDPRDNATTMTYDPSGNILTRTGPAPSSYGENWTWTARSDVQSFTDRRGKTTDLGYDSAGNLTTVTGPDPDSTGPLARPVTQYVRDPAGTGLITDVIDPAAHSTHFGYDPAGTGYRTSILTPNGNKTTFGYDSAGRVTSIVEPRGNVTGCGCATQYTTSYTYDAAGHKLTETNALANPTTFNYDSAGNLDSVTNAKLKTWTYGYNEANERTRETAPDTSHTDVEYDARGNISATTDAMGDRTTFSYDDANRLGSKVDPRGNAAGANPADYIWTYGYDAANNPTATTSPDPDGAGPVSQSVTGYGYDELNRRTSVTDPNGHATSIAYDGDDNVTQVTPTDPDGPGPLGPSSVQYGYDAVNRQVTVTDALGKTTTTSYDAAGNTASVITPLGFKTTYGYDNDNQLTSRVEPRGYKTGNTPAAFQWTYGYDPAGHPTTVTSPDPDGAGSLTPFTATTTYDRVGRPASRADGNGHTVGWAYDELGQLTKTTAPDPDGTGPLVAPATNYGYDQVNNLVSRTDANTHLTSYGYDLAQRLTSVVKPLSKTWTFGYDNASNLTSRVDAKANAAGNAALGTTTFVYDPLGRLTALNYSDTTPDVSFAYDKAGNRTSISDGGGAETSVYDNANRLSSISRGSDTFSYLYDSRDAVTQRTYPDATAVANTYDNDGRLATVASAGQTTSYGYDEAANLATTTLPAGNGYVETRQYDNGGRLNLIKNVKGTTTLSSYTITLDKAGNPTLITKPGANNVESFKYDNLDRITEACYKASCTKTNDPYLRWTYDPVGNRLSEARQGQTTVNSTYDVLDRLTQQGTTTYTSDDNGNQTAAGTRTYVWNTAGQLTSSTQTGTTITYAYDGLGNRATATSGATVTKSLWDRNAALPMLALERNGTNTLLRRYVFGNDIISETTPAGAYYLHYDNNGSATNATNATGVTQWTRLYEPFGTKRSESSVSGAPVVPAQYTGQYLDPTTSLYNLRARQYDPTGGRFLSTDPLARAISDPYVAAYAYASNQPTVLVDPSGMYSAPGLKVLSDRIDSVTNIAIGAGQAVSDTAIGVATDIYQLDRFAYGYETDIKFQRTVNQALNDGLERCLGDVGNCRTSAFSWATEQLRACGDNLDDARNATRFCVKAIAGIAIGGLRGVKGLKAAGDAARAADGILAPGPFAGGSIPAVNGPSRAFKPAERAEINRIGARTGCHRCGTTDPGTGSGNFVPDHQPPNAVNPAGGPQELYPHCIQCSREQGLAIARRRK